MTIDCPKGYTGLFHKVQKFHSKVPNPINRTWIPNKNHNGSHYNAFIGYECCRMSAVERGHLQYWSIIVLWFDDRTESKSENAGILTFNLYFIEGIAESLFI